MILPTWTLKPHLKGDTINSKTITFPFDISTCKIELQFRMGAGSVIFYWSTENNTFEKTSDYIVTMKSRMLDFRQGTYTAFLKITFQDGTAQTYLKANIKII